RPEDEDQQEEWELQRLEALELIESTLSPDHMLNLAAAGYTSDEESDPFILWSTCLRIFGCQTKEQYREWSDELTNIKRSDFATLKDMLRRVTYLRQQLEKTSKKLDDDQMMTTMIRGLRGYYKDEMLFIGG